jgi:N-acetylmuramoyl-L-alanine amidase
MFPWKQFADAGLVVWPDAARVAVVTPIFQTQLPDVAWYQKKLATWGYGLVESGNLDEQTRTVLSAFQMKYRPANIDGMPDVETAALLEALTNPAGPLPQLPPPAVPLPVPVPDTVTEPVRETAPAPAVADPNTVPATPPAKVQH